VGTSLLNNENNQSKWHILGRNRIFGSKKSVQKRQNKFSVGTSLKLLFQGSYTNFGADKFQINIVVGEAYLNDTKANLNIAYSGNLNNGFTDFGSYSKSEN
jgi:hypothetical protein